jgi:hypothetical protein
MLTCKVEICLSVPGIKDCAIKFIVDVCWLLLHTIIHIITNDHQTKVLEWRLFVAQMDSSMVYPFVELGFPKKSRQA